MRAIRYFGYAPEVIQKNLGGDFTHRRYRGNPLTGSARSCTSLIRCSVLAPCGHNARAGNAINLRARLQNKIFCDLALFVHILQFFAYVFVVGLSLASPNSSLANNLLIIKNFNLKIQLYRLVHKKGRQDVRIFCSAILPF